MSLLDPTLGELWDRMTIEGLRASKRGSGSGGEELEAIGRAIGARPVAPGTADCMARLSEVNRKLWDLIDRMARAEVANSMPYFEVLTVARLGKAIWELNQERRWLVAEIDAIAAGVCREH